MAAGTLTESLVRLHGACRHWALHAVDDQLPQRDVATTRRAGATDRPASDLTRRHFRFRVRAHKNVLSWKT